MSKFAYLSSWDQLTWEPKENFYISRCTIRWGDRLRVRYWIEDCCNCIVYCWNGTSTPTVGQTNWGTIVSPQENRCYLIFTDPHDNDMFLLKYTAEFDVKHFGQDLAKAYVDSRQY